MKIDHMEKAEIVRRLNNMCVNKMRYARMEERMAFGDSMEAEKDRRDAFALNRAALMVDVHMI